MKPQSKWTEEEWEKALKRVAGHLESIEKRIVNLLLERAQFKRNNIVYRKGKIDYKQAKPGESFLDARLREFEEIDARAGRYRTPEEVPFNLNLPNPKKKVKIAKVDRYSGVMLEQFDPEEYEKGKIVDLTPKIYKKYQKILDHICVGGNDGQHGSATERDIPLLRALSERIHYGSMYVAECKFNMHPEVYKALIERRDTQEMKVQLRRKPIEKEIFKRIKKKVTTAQENENPDVRRLLLPSTIVRVYRNAVIPLTIQGEVNYFLERKVA